MRTPSLSGLSPHARRVLYLVLALLLAAGVIAWVALRAGAPSAPIRIGVLHSLTGTMADDEKPLADAATLAVETINAHGGLLGRRVEMLLVDTRSDPAYAAQEAERLITQEQVVALFGCWTSSCRKAVLPVVERHKHLLFYSVQYEGMEASEHVYYLGATPNQQIIPGIRWAIPKFGKRILLTGSDYVFPRTANRVIRDLAGFSGAQVVDELYVPLGGTDFTRVIDAIRTLKPDFIANTINGDSNKAFFDALVAAHLENTPVISFSISESGVRNFGAQRLTRHYGVGNYFQSLPDADNTQFVSRLRQRFGAQAISSAPLVSTYMAVQLWGQGVTKAGTVVPDLVRNALHHQSAGGPGGAYALDKETHHTWQIARIGRINAEGEFAEVFATTLPIRPERWPAYRSKAQWKAILDEEQRP